MLERVRTGQGLGRTLVDSRSACVSKNAATSTSVRCSLDRVRKDSASKEYVRKG